MFFLKLTTAAVLLSPLVSGAVVTRIACGSLSPVVDSAGNTWNADSGFSGGTISAQPAAPTPQTQHLRYANTPQSFKYTFQLNPGKNYIVTLGFIEPTVTGPNQRIFSVTAQGRLALIDLDLFKVIGATNLTKEYGFSVQATADGKLQLSFAASVRSAVVSYIVIDQPPDPTFTSVIPTVAADVMPTPPQGENYLFFNSQNLGRTTRIDEKRQMFLVETPPPAPQNVCTDVSFAVKQYFNFTTQFANAPLIVVPANTTVTETWIIEDQVLTGPATIGTISASIGTSGAPNSFAGPFQLMGKQIPPYRQYPINVSANTDQQLFLTLAITAGSANLSDLTAGIVKTRVCTLAPTASLVGLETCVDGPNQQSCSGMYRAAMHTGAGLVKITGVQGDFPNSNVWNAIK